MITLCEAEVNQNINVRWREGAVGLRVGQGKGYVTTAICGYPFMEFANQMNYEFVSGDCAIHASNAMKKLILSISNFKLLKQGQ